MEEEGVRFFLLAGNERALLVDSGMMTRNAKEIAESLTDLPISLVSTHADPDHIASNDEFPSFYMHSAEAVNYYNVQKRKGRFIPVDDGYVFNLGERLLQVIQIPGHTPGSIALFEKERGVLISGDTVQDGSIYMFGIMREMHAYLESLRKLERMMDSFRTVWPSHGSFPLSPDAIPQLRESAEKYLKGEFEGEETEIWGERIMKMDAAVASFLTPLP